MLIDMTFVRVVEVTIVQVVGVAAVTYGWVTTARAVLMRMVGMGGGGASRHGIASLCVFKMHGRRSAALCGDV